MPKPRMSVKKLLINLSAAFSFLGCAGAPDKPQIELCVINTQAVEPVAYCGMTSGASMKTGRDVTYVNVRREILHSTRLEIKPISYLDNAIAMTPKNWEPLKNYIDDLETYIQYNCSK